MHTHAEGREGEISKSISLDHIFGMCMDIIYQTETKGESSKSSSSCWQHDSVGPVSVVEGA